MKRRTFINTLAAGSLALAFSVTRSLALSFTLPEILGDGELSEMLATGRVEGREFLILSRITMPHGAKIHNCRFTMDRDGCLVAVGDIFISDSDFDFGKNWTAGYAIDARGYKVGGNAK